MRRKDLSNNENLENENNDITINQNQPGKE